MKIFYADDDQDEIGFFCEALKTIDCSIECITASNGEEALKLLQQLPPDIIFLDLHMPKMNGMECLIKLKMIPALKDVPVIIYSNADGEDRIAYLRQLGAAQFLSKNHNIADLSQQLRMILTDPELVNHVQF
jgi:CheY-like chemotaxis protein